MDIFYQELEEEELKKFYDFFAAKVHEFFTDEYGKNTVKYFLSHEDSRGKVQEVLKKGHIFVAKESEKIVGLLLVRDRPDGGVSFCSWIAVDKNYWGKGIATKLIKLWEKKSLVEGAHLLTLITDKSHVPFYQKQGFTLLGIIPKGYYGVPDYWFYKIIQEPKEKNYLR